MFLFTFVHLLMLMKAFNHLNVVRFPYCNADFLDITFHLFQHNFIKQCRSADLRGFDWWTDDKLWCKVKSRRTCFVYIYHSNNLLFYSDQLKMTQSVQRNKKKIQYHFPKKTFLV